VGGEFGKNKNFFENFHCTVIRETKEKKRKEKLYFEN
jgi:hypothetical protein